MARGRPLAAGLVLLVACSGGPAHTESSRPGRAPDRVGGHAYCLLDAPVTASGRLFYPPLYPSEAIPDADRCFASVGEARRTGLTPAPPPPGSKFVDGIYFMPTDAAMVATCRRTARRLRFAVACPRLAPSPVDALDGPFKPDFLLEERFRGPPTYVGAGTAGAGGLSIGHLWVESSPTRLSVFSICYDRTVHAVRATVRGRTAAFVSCPEGSSTHSGHVVLFWREAGDWHLVSLHGHTSVNRRLDTLIATSSRIIRP